jgi:hypothetical protein
MIFCEAGDMARTDKARFLEVPVRTKILRDCNMPIIRKQSRSSGQLTGYNAVECTHEN